MRLVLSVTFVGMIVFFLLVSGGRIEGLIYPVVTRGEITRYEALGETYTRIWGRSQRLRDCSFAELQWGLGDLDHFSVADLVFEEGTRVRPGGAFEFGPWLVQLTPDQLLRRSFALVRHRCHPLWLTETVFFVSPP